MGVTRLVFFQRLPCHVFLADRVNSVLSVRVMKIYLNWGSDG